MTSVEIDVKHKQLCCRAFNFWASEKSLLLAEWERQRGAQDGAREELQRDRVIN